MVFAVSGWYCRPRDSYIEGPYPGLLILPGYVSEPTLPKHWAKKGYAAIGVAPRGKLRSNSQYNPGYPGLLVDNIIDRNTYAYRGFYIDAMRAVDFALTRPEIDASRIGLQGGSQGGALTITTAALRSGKIACGAAGAPYLCGFMDAASLTHSYPYEEMNEYMRLYPERIQQVRDTVAYFDGINFAPQITCPMHVSLGLCDDVCPPETGFDVIRAMTNSDVSHNAYERCGHESGAYWKMANIEAFLAKHLRPDRAKVSSEKGDMMTAAVAGPVKPADFDAYWNAIDDELARFPIAAEARHTPLHDTEFSTSYDVELTGIGPYRFLVFFRFPRERSLSRAPDHAALWQRQHPAHWDDRQRYICFTSFIVDSDWRTNRSRPPIRITDRRN